MCGRENEGVSSFRFSWSMKKSFPIWTNPNPSDFPSWRVTCWPLVPSGGFRRDSGGSFSLDSPRLKKKDRTWMGWNFRQSNPSWPVARSQEVNTRRYPTTRSFAVSPLKHRGLSLSLFSCSHFSRKKKSDERFLIARFCTYTHKRKGRAC